jgi:thioredoxin 1
MLKIHQQRIPLMKKNILKLVPVLAAFMLMLNGNVLEQVRSCSAAGFSGKAFAAETVKKTAAKAKVTFIELGSVNCIPCKAMQPVMNSIEKKYNGKVKVVFYDVWTDEGQPFGQKYGIQAIPTQIFLDENGREFFRHTGFFPEENIDRIIASKGITN